VPNDETIVCVPFAASAVAFVYNIPTLYYDAVLNLTPEIILGIFNGTITRWNDPLILKENMFEYLPDATIVPIYRYGETGTTYILTSYLSSISSEWTRVHGNATYSSDIFKMLPYYNDTVTYSAQMAKLEDIPNSITYIGYGYTKMRYTYSIANVKDATGQISLPIQSSTMRKAYVGTDANDRSVTALFNKPSAYPIVAYSNWCFLRNQTSATALEMWRFFEKAYMGGISLTGIF
jgi:phosphate transport system substrate-binding protein